MSSDSDNSILNPLVNQLPNAPIINGDLIKNYEYKDPPEITIKPLEWKNIKINEVPIPDDTEIENYLQNKFDLSNLFKQIKLP